MYFGWCAYKMQVVNQPHSKQNSCDVNSTVDHSEFGGALPQVCVCVCVCLNVSVCVCV